MNVDNEIKRRLCCKQHSSCTARSSFFTERVINIRNSLPVDTDFSSLAVIRQVNRMDFLEFRRCIAGSF